uniref:Uncharacterized protein MANES_04G098900 n=1 Tax=Rhizophora mucronata TaxID=61149 RepID=A0A2P2JZS0_RHIMU
MMAMGLSHGNNLFAGSNYRNNFLINKSNTDPSPNPNGSY